MSFWKRYATVGGGGRKSLNPKLLSRLRLESLDGRIVPDGTPIMDPAMMPTTQTSPDTQVAIPPVPQATIAPVTNVAVVPLTDDAGNATDVYMILEQAGNDYIVTYYDAIANQLFASTDATTLTTPANAQLDAMMLQYGTPGDINTLFMANAEPAVVAPLADPQATGPAVTPAQAPATPVPVIVLPSARPLPLPIPPPIITRPLPYLPPRGLLPPPRVIPEENTLPRYEPRTNEPGIAGWRPVWIVKPGDGVLPTTKTPGYVSDPDYVPDSPIIIRPLPDLSPRGLLPEPGIIPQENTLPRYEPRTDEPGIAGWRPVWIVKPGDGVLPSTKTPSFVYDPTYVPPGLQIQLNPAPPTSPPFKIPNITGVSPSPTLPGGRGFDPIPPLPPGTMPRPNNRFENPRPTNPNYPFGRGSIIGPSTPTPGTPPLIPGQMSPSGR